MISTFQAPPVNTPFFDGNNKLSDGWLRYFQQISLALSTVPVPASSTSRGAVYQIAVDDNFFYVCTAPNTWRRAALAAF